MNLKILIPFLFCCFNHLNGQGLYGKYLGTEQGLLSKECYDINFDEEGYMIVGTQYGPVKYDGEKFIPICLNLPIERRIIYDFEKDAKGKVYLLNSKNEIFILKKNNAVRISVKIPTPIPTNIHFKKLHWYSKGLIIFTNGIYYTYQFKTKHLDAFNKKHKEHYNAIVYDYSKEFPLERQQSKYLNIPNHAVVFRLLKKRIQLVKEEILYESRDDLIRVGNAKFVLVNSNLYHVFPNKIEALPYKNILFMEFFHNRLWLGTVDGLIEVDKTGNLIQKHFCGQLIGGMVPLPGKGMAVSLNQKGIFICSNIHERFYRDIKPSQVSNHQTTIIIGNKTGELFQFQDNKLFKIQDQIQPVISNTNGVNPANIRQIQFINNRWHICIISGTYTLSSDLKRIEKKMISKYNSFSDFFISKETIYCISWSGILPIKPNQNQMNLPLIRCKYQLNDSIVLLGSEEGLFEFHVNHRKLIRSKLFKKPLYISNIQELSPNEFLISSRYEGIFHFKNGHLLKKYEAPCLSVKKAMISEGQVIAAGNQGIYVKPLDADKKIPWTKIFRKEIQNVFVVKRKMFICSDDDLITKELSAKYETRKPAVVLTEILLGGKKTQKLPKEINYNIPISLDFDILSFDANKLRLYYRLNGETKRIQYTEGTKINFEALPSGHYQLELFPVIDGKIQFSNSKKYFFTIKQPFWESTLFYLLISIVIFLLMLSIRLVRNLQRKKRIAERAELESKINEYKLLAVKAQVNPHFLSNGLAAIQALILKGDNDHAAHYLAKFSFLMRKTLHYSDTQFISISQELQLVDAYLELELLRAKNRFKVHQNIQLSESELNTFKIPSLLLQPILENAIWHGLTFQEDNPELLISLQWNQNRVLVIEISDNGPGFDTTTKKEGHVSKGNQLITERISTLNQQFKKQVATVEILTSGAGTKVVFTFTSEIYKSE